MSYIECAPANAPAEPPSQHGEFEQGIVMHFGKSEKRSLCAWKEMVDRRIRQLCLGGRLAELSALPAWSANSSIRLCIPVG